jgi:glutamate racemase
MIGIFDSGYGGLTILSKIRQLLPEYDYIYLGDNARAPYGTRSFDVIYDYTLQAVNFLHQQGCSLIILACNTASAKALRTIQQHNIDPNILRVLGVIRPTVEVVTEYTKTKHIGVLATPGTVTSESYVIELLKQDPSLTITQQACPMWVPLIESGEYIEEGANYFVEKYLTELLARDPLIDTIILGCTHYPLLQPKIEDFLANRNCNISVIAQGDIVANSLQDYLRRHPEIDLRVKANNSQSASVIYLTTESAKKFSESASIFLADPIEAQHIEL